MSYHKDARDSHDAKLRRMVGGSVTKAEVKKIADAAVHAHERHDHKGEKLTKFKAGGKVDGEKGAKRLDRYARGGRTKKRGDVNIVIAMAPHDAAPPVPPPAAGAGPQAVPVPVPKPVPVIPAAAPAGPVPGAMPRKRGGRTVKMDAGAGSGAGRLEKVRAYGKNARK